LQKKTDKITISVKFFNDIKKLLKDDEIIENEIMSRHTTFKIGGSVKYFIKPKTINQIIGIIELCNKYKIPYFILGNGSNLLVSDEGYYGVVIQIHEYNFSNLEVKREDENNYLLKVGGGMLMKTLAIEACLLSLTGFEDIIDIPGTVGGGIIMNASYRKRGLFIPLQRVKVITPEGIIREINKKDCRLVTRGSMLKDKKYLVIEAIFKLKIGDKFKIQKNMTDNTKLRYASMPMYFGSAGCFFVWNRYKYGSLYEKYRESNLVSYRVGNAMIYTYNIAFIVNLGKSKASDVMKIVNHVEKIIKEKYGIKMKREVVTLGSFNEIEYYFLAYFSQAHRLPNYQI
jgi:UDP-N-acetylmuramate dehydrogenase